jgi:hypothetical protein
VSLETACDFPENHRLSSRVLLDFLNEVERREHEAIIAVGVTESIPRKDMAISFICAAEAAIGETGSFGQIVFAEESILIQHKMNVSLDMEDYEVAGVLERYTGCKR